MNQQTYDILLVEDNPDHAELVIRSLESHPLTNKIHHLSDGEAALDYLFQRGRFDDAGQCPRPHIVLLDLGLPKIRGLEVLEKIRESPDLDRVPVVVLTTSNAESDVGDAYKLHANSYLVKPHDFEKFTNLMEALGFYWLRWNHYPGQNQHAWL